MLKNPKELAIRVLKPFGMNGQATTAGEILTVEYAFARELIGNQKAERHEPATEPAAPSATKSHGRKAGKE